MFVIGNVVLTIFILATLYTPLNVVSFTVNPNGPSAFVPGILYSVVFGFSILIFTFSFVRWYARFYSYTLLQREQIKLLSTTLTFTILSLIGGFIILPAISPDLSPYSILAHVAIALFLAQLQINILSRNAVINFRISLKSFAIFMGLVSVIFAEFLLLRHFVTVGADWFSLFLLFPILTIVSLKLYTSAQDRWVRIPAKVYVTEFTKESVTLYQTSDVSRKLLYTLHKVLPQAVVEIVLQKNFVNRAVLNKLVDFLSMRKDKITVIGPEMLIDEMVIAKQTKDEKKYQFTRELYDEIMSADIALLLPLSFKDVLEGAVIVKGGIIADNFVLNELKILAQSSSIAFSRAQLYEEVKSFAKSLSTKVRERTKELGFAREELEVKNKALSKALTELQSLDKAKSDFISMASHQLRTPISIARGYLSMLAEGDFGKPTEQQDKLLQKVLEGLRQLNSIVEDILNTSRIEQGRLVINYEDSDIVHMLRDVITELEKKAADRGLQVIFRTKLVKCPAYVDKNKLFEVYLNLIDNAIVYTPSGNITVDLVKKKQTFVVSVKDTGIGIPMSQRSQIFKRFSRLENAKKVRPDGSGIGLFTAKTIVEMHKGKIWFTSKLNHGTTFYTEIPSENESARKALEAGSNTPGTGVESVNPVQK